MKQYQCLECGLSSRFGEIHKLDCSSKFLMQGYVRVLEEIRKFPQDLIDNLLDACHTETLDRAYALDEYSDMTNSLGLYNEK